MAKVSWTANGSYTLPGDVHDSVSRNADTTTNSDVFGKLVVAGTLVFLTAILLYAGYFFYRAP